METKPVMTCIICPMGCRLELTVKDGKVVGVEGNGCARGPKYAAAEFVAPRRTLTTTVKCRGKLLRVCPCKTSGTIRKGDQFRIMEIVNTLEVNVPVELGQVLVQDIGGTGVDLIATRAIPE